MGQLGCLGPSLSLSLSLSLSPPSLSLPFSLSVVMSQQLLILEMFIITLVTRLLYRRQYDPLPDESQDDENTKMVPALANAPITA